MGLVKALGASPWRVFGEMSLEVVLLAAVGAAIGMIIGGAASLHLSLNGIDTTSFAGQIEMNGVVWDPIWRADFDFGRIVRTPLSLLPIAVLAGVYPAIHAARVVPVVALRRIS
jgi:ABC-type lipoprotein release transport system permease subunit